MNYQRRNTVGKRLRNAKQLRKKDPQAIVQDIPPQLQEYVTQLQTQGLKYNKVRYAMFLTKNKLPYPGLIATEKIISNETLVKVPMPLLLTTRHAFLSPLQVMFRAYPQYYSNQYAASWEDHMLLAFLLYEYQRGRESPWYLLIMNLPREIDYLVFWPPEELALLNDPVLTKQAQKQHREFMLEFDTFKVISSKFPQFFREDTVTLENVRWIYTHLVTRCFGKYLNFVTMVPFCELFNHECIDVFYDFEYNNDNPYKSEESEPTEPTELTQDEQDSMTSSEGSYNSDDEVSDGEYLDMDGQLHQSEEVDFELTQELEKQGFFERFKESFNIEVKEDESEEAYNGRMKDLQDLQIKMRKEFNIKQNLQREIYLLSKDIKQWMQANLDYGDNYSLFFIAQMYNRSNKCLGEYLNGKKAYFMVREDMKRIQLHCSTYKTHLYNHMKDVMKKPITNTTSFAQKQSRQKDEELNTPELILSQEIECEQDYYDRAWDHDKFDHFVMKCSRKDQFEEGAQVYFCYGRLSNRMMLMRYGMALEHNKYDHVHMRVEYLQYLKNEDVVQLAYKYKVSKYKRFKLRYTGFPIDLVIFCKAIHWTFNIHSLDTFFMIQDLKLEMQGLQMALHLVTQFLKNNFTKSVEELEAELYNQTLGYHEHFAVIFQLERQRIVIHQMKLLNICIAIIQRMLDGIDYTVAILRVSDYEPPHEFETNRILLKKYFESMRFALHIPK